MKLAALSAPLLVKLLELDRHAERLAELAERAESELATARDILNGKREDPRIDLEAIKDGFNTVVATAKRRRAAADAEQTVLSGAKLWLELLPPDAELEPVEPTLATGERLEDVRRAKLAVATDIRALRAVPVPSPDLRERVQSYVADLAHAGRPDVRGVDGGELKVRWPGGVGANRHNLDGFSAERVNGLLMAAYLFPDLLTERLVATVDEATSKPMPPAQRAARIAQLAAEQDQLARVEVALVDAAVAAGSDDEVHDSTAAPQLILGCRVQARAQEAAE